MDVVLLTLSSCIFAMFSSGTPLSLKAERNDSMVKKDGLEKVAY